MQSLEQMLTKNVKTTDKLTCNSKIILEHLIQKKEGQRNKKQKGKIEKQIVSDA